MAKICLLICSAPFLIDERVFPPLGLMAVGTALRVQGHDVTIKSTPDDSDYFAMGPTTPEYSSALWMLRGIKSQGNSRKVIIGGPHAVANAEQCLDDGFDVVAFGDGENITVDTFNASGVVDLERKPLDVYPILDRSLIQIHEYRYSIAGRNATTLLTTRGCPYQCGFCAKTENQTRYRSVVGIEREVSYLQREWGCNALMLFDDTFILRKERAELICGVLKRHGMLWRCFVRGDLVVRHGRELLDVMAESGCIEVGIGVESGSDRILRGIGKGEDVGTIQAAIAILRESRIRVKGFFIIGLPGESVSSINATRRFVLSTPMDAADFTLYQPYKGSPIYDNRQHYDIDWDDAPPEERFYKGRRGEHVCTVRTSALSTEEITEARNELEDLFMGKTNA